MGIITVRAKFECVEVEDQPQYEQKVVKLFAVTDGSEENKSFYTYTASGSLEMCVSYNTIASKAFEKGKEYYIDITQA